jgi:hypothetical protein
MWKFAINISTTFSGMFAGNRVMGMRQHQRARAVVAGDRVMALQRARHRERAAHRAQVAAQRQLAGDLEAVDPRGVELPARGQDAERDRHVEAARFGRSAGARVDRPEAGPAVRSDSVCHLTCATYQSSLHYAVCLDS